MPCFASSSRNDGRFLKLRPLRILLQQPANIFPAAAGLPDWLQRRVVLNFETRTIENQDKSSTVYLACGVSTRNIIEASCADMLEANVPLVGRYVETRSSADDPRVESYLRLAGRVTDIRGSKLTLEDFGDGEPSIEAANAFLEPRPENMAWCVKQYTGSNADRVLDQADATAMQLLGGRDRLSLIGKTFDYLRNQTVELVPGAPLVLGPLAGSKPAVPALSIRTHQQATSRL